MAIQEEDNFFGNDGAFMEFFFKEHLFVNESKEWINLDCHDILNRWYGMIDLLNRRYSTSSHRESTICNIQVDYYNKSQKMNAYFSSAIDLRNDAIFNHKGPLRLVREEKRRRLEILESFEIVLRRTNKIERLIFE